MFPSQWFLPRSRCHQLKEKSEPTLVIFTSPSGWHKSLLSVYLSVWMVGSRSVLLAKIKVLLDHITDNWSLPLNVAPSCTYSITHSYFKFKTVFLKVLKGWTFWCLVIWSYFGKWVSRRILQHPFINIIFFLSFNQSVRIQTTMKF